MTAPGYRITVLLDLKIFVSALALLGCSLGQTTQPSVPSSFDNVVALLDDPTTVNGLEGMVEIVKSANYRFI